MTTNEIQNMTASGPSLRELVIDLTGADPLAPEHLAVFLWSNTDRCVRCGVFDSTALVNVDGDRDDRLCFHCLQDRVLS